MNQSYIFPSKTRKKRVERDSGLAVPLRFVADPKQLMLVVTAHKRLSIYS